MTFIDDFPVADMGELAEPPDVMPLDWEPRLSVGREIFMTRIQQPQTYGGMLCGLPRVQDRTVAEAIRVWDRSFHGAPVVIPATLVRGTKHEPEDPHDARLTFTSLAMIIGPHFLTIRQQR